MGDTEPELFVLVVWSYSLVAVSHLVVFEYLSSKTLC